MTWTLKSLAAAAAFVAAGSTSAFTATLNTNDTLVDYGVTLSGLSGTGTLTFSSVLIGALNAGKVTATGLSPATATVTYKTNNATKVVSIATASAAAPIQSLQIDLTNDGLTLQKVNALGGARLTAANANIATTGGFLEVSNLSVDLSAKKVFATLNGGNGVGLLNNVELWDIATITGPISYDLSSPPSYYYSFGFTNTVSGLKINANAYNLFATSLGLTANGKLSLSTVTDFGTITSTVSITVGLDDAITPDVPEPATYALVAVGLLAANLATRRRRAKQ